MIERLNDYDQQRVLGAVKAAAKDVSGGANPNKALVRHCSSARLSKDLVKRACESFNVSKTLAHLAENDGEKRAESFAIADPNNVIGQMWPTEVSYETGDQEFPTDAFDLSSYSDKAASCDVSKLRRDNIILDEVGPESIENALSKIKAACVRRIDELRTESTSLYLNINEGFKKIASHFEALYRPDYEQFCKWAFSSFGESELDILRTIGENLSTKRASLVIEPTVALKDDYEDLHYAIKQAGQVMHALSVWKEETAKFDEKVAGFNYQPVTPETLGPLFNSSMLGPATNIALSPQYNPKAEQGRISNIKYDPFSDPLMKDVSQTRTLLDSALALNSAMKEDEVLKNADPKAVLSNYNDIFASVPELTKHPALLKATLRYATEYGQLDSNAMRGLIETYSKTNNRSDVLKQLSERAGEKSKSQLESYHKSKEDITKKRQEVAKLRAEAKKDKKDKDPKMEDLKYEEQVMKNKQMRKRLENNKNKAPSVGKSNKKEEEEGDN